MVKHQAMQRFIRQVATLMRTLSKGEHRLNDIKTAQQLFCNNTVCILHDFIQIHHSYENEESQS